MSTTGAPGNLPLIDDDSEMEDFDTFFNGIATALNSALSAMEAKYGAFLPAGATPGYVPSGTSSQRDAFYGTPSTSPNRVALANKAPRWFNTDKGFEQQYFGQSSDAGTAYVRGIAGWYPVEAMVPISSFTVSGTGVAKVGSRIGLTSANSISVSDCFTSDFSHYMIVMEIDSASAAATPNIQLSSGGSAASSTNYGYSRHEFGPTALDTSAGSQTAIPVGRVGTLGGNIEIKLFSPQIARRTQIRSVSGDADRYGDQIVGNFGLTTQFDGFKISQTQTLTGFIYIYGINSF